MPPRVVIITGPKHCGKSTVTLALRRKTVCRSGDLDTIIEKRTGKSARELYKEGAEIFRRAEAEVLEFVLRREEETRKNEPLILASGGGIIDNEAAMNLISGRAGIVVVFLDLDAEEAWFRIDRSAKKPGGSLPAFLSAASDPKAAHKELHERRAALYRAAAGLVISMTGKDQPDAAEEIIVKLGLTRR